MATANDVQVGGAHYKGGSYQHWDLMAATVGIGYHTGNATKYLVRWRDKNGLEDLKKARHYVLKAKELVEAGAVNPCGPGAKDEVDRFNIAHGLTGKTEAILIDMIIRWDNANTLGVAAGLLELMIKDNGGSIA